ncbi:tetratricopeptide repeat protein [Flavobacterium antarcticum]|uniref:tetratricopeptide repeat protein n=1 Tax=Flavobacterium antarcticum TaxID=271155 RepID=UPI0003B5F428|nr:tetratricopeptide repeat protein [Flavobacterium antarcticum]
MNKLKIFSVAFLAIGATAVAQDLEQAQKAIDAEKFDKAKSILKTLTTADADQGKNFFILGNLYLMQKVEDSAQIYFQKGLAAKKNANFNYIGLGQMALNNNDAVKSNENFNKAQVDMRRKDFEEFLHIGRAYLNAETPNYKSALLFLNKAKDIQPNDAQVLLSLGDAYYGEGNTNEAYSAYRNAYDADKSVLKAKLQLGFITIGSKAFQEAKTAFENIIALDPNYGPAYRGLAETYYVWSLNDTENYAEKNKKALEYYDKYLALTDYSLDSRMRHADFLILTKDYAALEKEALEMKKLDKVNPRILRYLGYSAYENGNDAEAIKALNEFLSTPNAKPIGRDYLYLGMAKTHKALTTTKDAEGADVNKVDQTLFTAGVADMLKGVQMDPAMANELNDIGKKFFDIKLYNEAAAIYEVATSNPNSQNFLYDNFYLGYALYFGNVNLPQGQKIDPIIVEKASKAFDNVIAVSPTTQDAYIYKARVNSLLENNAEAQAKMAANYEEFIKVVNEKGAEEASKPANQTKFVEAYTNIATYYANSDKAKAREYYQKALAIDPTNEAATARLKALK